MGANLLSLLPNCLETWLISEIMYFDIQKMVIMMMMMSWKMFWRMNIFQINSIAIQDALKNRKSVFLTENLDGFNKAFTEWKTHRCTVKITVVFIKASCNGWSVTFEFLVFLEILKCFYLLHNQFECKPVAFFLWPLEWNQTI